MLGTDSEPDPGGTRIILGGWRRLTHILNIADIQDWAAGNLRDGIAGRGFGKKAYRKNAERMFARFKGIAKVGLRVTSQEFNVNNSRHADRALSVWCC